MTKILLAVSNPSDWPLNISGVEVISAKSYITSPELVKARGVKIFNLCRSYRYQSVGYYVSLLAAARGHMAIPSVTTIQDLKTQSIIKIAGDNLDEQIQQSLKNVNSQTFELSIYFGRSLAQKYQRLAKQLFNAFQAPLLRAYFVREKEWRLQNIEPIAASNVPPNHWDLMLSYAHEYFNGRSFSTPKRIQHPYFIAILHSAEEINPPSDEKALKRFMRAANKAGLGVDLIGKEDIASLGEYDALFIRETTSVNHHTYRFSRKAVAEGLTVMDDPESILKCSNKVFLSELLEKHKISTPRTIVAHKENSTSISRLLGFPCILKQPDSSFSQGVSKANNEEELILKLEKLFKRSELVIAQEFLATEFDWRIGVLNQKLLYACKYFMARDHWQILNWEKSKESSRFGKVETVPLEEVPAKVLKVAIKASSLIGDGLYGVDIKEINGKCYVIEVNDNPTIQAGFEDKASGMALYEAIMNTFLERIKKNKEANV